MPPRATRAKASPAPKRSPSPPPPSKGATPSKRASAKSPASAVSAPSPEPPAHAPTTKSTPAAAKPRAAVSSNEPRFLKVLKAVLFVPWILCACGCIGVVVYAKAVHSPPHGISNVIHTIIENGGGVQMGGSVKARISVEVDGTTSGYDPKRCDNRLCEDESRLN